MIMGGTNTSPSPMRVHYVVNARIPHTRAYGIQVAKMCEALIEAGVSLTLIIPRTQASRISMQTHNRLRVEVPTVVLPGFDGYSHGRLAFVASSLLFMIVSFLHLLREKLAGRLDIVYTIDMDTFSYGLLPLLGVPCFVEMHATKRRNAMNTFFFKHAAGIIATNKEIRHMLMERFMLTNNRVLVEPNGVDFQQFENAPSRSEARRQLSLAPDARIALYAGRFYTWKRLDILADACRHMPDVQCYVIGGDRTLFERVTGVANMPANLHIAGERESDEVPLWLAAADALLLLGTKSNEHSYRETAPMKIYEYMAARRPIIASRTRALESIVARDSVLFYEPDNAQDLARNVRAALENTGAIGEMIVHATEEARLHAWKNRAREIVSFISETI